MVRGSLGGVIGTLDGDARNRHKRVISVDLLDGAVATRISVDGVEPYAA